MLYFIKIKEITNKSNLIKMLAFDKIGKAEYPCSVHLYMMSTPTLNFALTTVATLLPSDQ